MTRENAELLDAVAVALKKEFQKRFLKKDFSTTGTAFVGRPKKMHGCLSKLRKLDGTVNMQAISKLTRRAVNALHHIKGKGRLRFYASKLVRTEAKAANTTSTPPAKIALYWNAEKIRDEIGFQFHIKSYA